MTDEQILDAVLFREGGYVNHPADPGKCTNRGITIGTLRMWRRQDVTCDDVRDLTDAEAREIYRKQYLAPFADVAADVKPQVVDIAVNSGVSTARALLSRAQQQQTGRALGTQLAIERLRFYARIVKAKPTSSVFLLGWVDRACSFLE